MDKKQAATSELDQADLTRIIGGVVVTKRMDIASTSLWTDALASAPIKSGH